MHAPAPALGLANDPDGLANDPDGLANDPDGVTDGPDGAPDDGPFDSSRPFMPEELTPLPFTRSWERLSPPQRLRYNQLQALYFNEQVIFFETVLLRPVLAALLREPWPERVALGLAAFREEEGRHSEMFRRLNRRAAPGLYAHGDHCFIEVPAPWRAVVRWTTDRPLRYPMFLWLMLLQEERSIFYSRAWLRHRAELEPAFVAAHRRHVADEVGHVRWDEELLDAVWERASPRRRAWNARLFAWMVEEFFSTPKRAQLAVVDELARELPELSALLPQMRQQLLALGADPAFRRTLYSRVIVPRTFARFDGAPEFRGRAMCGYVA
jgi:hypothetical protein